MSDPIHPDALRLRVYVSEPFDFERENDSNDLFGWTMDHERDEDEWEIRLERGFRFHKTAYDRLLIGPHYVGEHLSKVHDALLGVPIRIAHRTAEGWHFAMTGMLSLAPPPPPPPPSGDETDTGTGPDRPDETTGS
ncbi:hypothetical protein LWE61_16935 [Sphingobium sufflavum]|uniref:hypothetical protein n=1 Tax=Sphingobium sufflavum TaxID=1129547 RepID=UPI001F492D42|nr:hypothetical protein [Sphingobium sufflavum]MCE7798225.1 hypothetical protein [Sphingobium sufflavum]